jgi:hypothetical protein
MKDKQKKGPPTAPHHKAQPSAVTDDGSELTAKEEEILATPSLSNELPEQIERKLEHEAKTANESPRRIQMAKFESKLEHDDPGNQPS